MKEKITHFRVCPDCGTEFYTTKVQQKFCWKCKAKRRAAGFKGIIATKYDRRKWNRDRRAFIAGAEGSHTRAEWLDKVRRLGWKCYYCGVKLSTETLTKDHFHAVSCGGSDYVDNLVPACRSCNSKKRNKLALSIFPLASTSLSEDLPRTLRKAKAAPVRYEGLRTSWAWKNPPKVYL